MSTDTFIALLLVSTFATVGIVTTLAVQSSRHWFLRTAVVVAMLAPLLAIPAPELFVTLLLEAATITAGFGVIELIRTRAASMRLSLQTLVLVTVLAGGLLAVGRSLPELNRYAWQSLVLMGIGSGLCVLLGLAAVARWPRWYLRLPPIVLASALIGLVLAWFDWFVPSLHNWREWPPDPRPVYVGQTLLPDYDYVRPITTWFAICPAITVGIVVWLRLATAAGLVRRTIRGDGLARTGSRIAKMSSVALVLVLGIMPAVVLLHLLTPGDVAPQRLPIPNAYDTIVDIGGSVQASPFEAIEWDWNTAPATTLTPAIVAIENDLDLLHDVLSEQSQVPLEYSRDDIGRSYIFDQRSLARALAARARLARLDGNPEEAFEPSLDTVRLGHSIRRGGLITHALVGIAASGIGFYDLYEHRDTLSVEQCRDACDVLLELERSAESFGRVNERDRLWSRIVMGWHHHLEQIAFAVSATSFSADTAYGGAFFRDRIIVRLLAVELALRAYRLDQGEYPTSLDQLVPDYIPHVPSDPCDASGAPPRYSRTDDGYLLYSLGGNHHDDGGSPPGEGEYAVLGDHSVGDLRLDAHFDYGTSPTTGATTGSIDESEDDAEDESSDSGESESP